MLRHLRSLKVLVFVAVAMGALVVGEFSQAIAESFLAAEEGQMTELVNQHRASHGMGSLSTNDALRMVARRQAQRMVVAGYIYHNPDLGKEADQAVPGWLLVGENVGVGPSVDAVQAAFLDSPKHHENIDTAKFNIVGVGAMANDSGDLFFTQNFAQWTAKIKPVAPPAAAPVKKAPAPIVRAVAPKATQPPAVATAPPPQPVVTASPTPTPTTAVLPATETPKAQASANLPNGVLAMFGRFLQKVAFWQ